MHARVVLFGVLLLAAVVGVAATTLLDGTREAPSLAALVEEDAAADVSEASTADGGGLGAATVERAGREPASRGSSPLEAARADFLAAGPRRAPIPRFPKRTVAELVRTRGWTSFLRTWHGVPLTSEGAPRGARAASATGEWLAGADPVVRQNLIFAVALMEPWDEASLRLRRLWKQAEDAGDAEDALCALAFSGDPEARGALLSLAKTPSKAFVRRLVDRFEDLDALAAIGGEATREALRAWRAVEALDRQPYFKLVPYYVTHDWSSEGGAALLGWRPGLPLTPEERQALLEAWLARWPGHPGSDGMALRIARLRLEAGDRPGAASWFARALTGADQDRAWRAEAPLVALVEGALPLETVAAFARAEFGDVPARTLFEYAWVRRTAAEVGFDAACVAVAAAAAREPEGALATAWRERYVASPPRGLSSGLTTLAETDPLLRIQASETGEGRPSWEDLTVRRGAWTPEARLEPDPEPTLLKSDRLRAQLRAWETLAELERRADRSGGLLGADLLYKQAAIFYHDPDVLHPAYDGHTYDFGRYVSSLDARDGSAPRDGAAFARTSFAWVRAAALFERIEREHPTYPALDKVLFSEAMCWKRLVDHRPAAAMAWLDGGDRGSLRRVGARRLVALFDRVVAEHPHSSLADDAAHAAAWWRRVKGDWLDERR